MMNSSSTTRRVITTMALCSISFLSRAQQEPDVIRQWMAYTDAPNSLYHHIAGETYALLEDRARKTAGLQTPAAWRSRQQQVRTALAAAVGPFPSKTPLRARITATHQKAGYRMENIVYESRPGYFVTSVLFMPDSLGANRKAPAILYCSGHSNTGYRSPAYLRVMLNLVQKGFIVMAFDPPGQGERLQYLTPDGRKSRFKWPTWEHSYPGAQLFLNGQTIANDMIWDGIRAIDYLVSRPETDPQRIGVTGRSGGGTQTAYIAALDERVKAAAPENYITSFKRLYQSLGPQDAEQHFFQGIARGLDIGDLLTARAPKPTLVITTTRDIFSYQGAKETMQEVQSAFTALGSPHNIKMVTDDAAHASTKKNREALYAFFQQHLSLPGNTMDEEVSLPDTAELHVTPTGQVATSYQGHDLFDIHLREAEQKFAQLDALRKKSPAGALVDAAKKISGYRAPNSLPVPIETGGWPRDGYRLDKALIDGEGKYPVPYLLFTPDRPNGKAAIWIKPNGKSTSADIELLARNGWTVLVPDMIGTGETGPGAFKGDSYIDSCGYNLWFAAMQTGRSITGIRAGDIVRLARLLRKDHRAVYGIAEGDISPALLHAAAFDTAFAGVALNGPLISYRSLASTRDYRPQFIPHAVAGSIGHYDLPDLAAAIATRRLLIAAPVNGKGERSEDIKADLTVIGKGGHFQLDDTWSAQTLLNWLNER
ncbi:alpha/beta hydrolase family protein [Chitinophaga lutea]